MVAEIGIISGWELILVLSVILFFAGLALQQKTKNESRRLRRAGRILTYISVVAFTISGIVIALTF